MHWSQWFYIQSGNPPPPKWNSFFCKKKKKIVGDRFQKGNYINTNLSKFIASKYFWGTCPPTGTGVDSKRMWTCSPSVLRHQPDPRFPVDEWGPTAHFGKARYFSVCSMWLWWEQMQDTERPHETQGCLEETGVLIVWFQNCEKSGKEEGTHRSNSVAHRLQPC